MICFFSNILIGLLPPEDGSNWPATWPKRVSDDPRHLMTLDISMLKLDFRCDVLVDHMIIIWPHDPMFLWSCDRTIIWSYDHMNIIWSYDPMIIWSSKNPKQKLGFRVKRWNVGDRLKRVLAKFHADRSHPRRVNRPSKFAKNSKDKIVEKWNVGDRPKCVLAKFEADRSQVWRQSL